MTRSTLKKLVNLATPRPNSGHWPEPTLDVSLRDHAARVLKCGTPKDINRLLGALYTLASNENSRRTSREQEI